MRCDSGLRPEIALSVAQARKLVWDYGANLAKRVALMPVKARELIPPLGIAFRYGRSSPPGTEQRHERRK